jgi:HPt (histidine-containing phosphotransfer) domain-containing protein
LENGFDAFISKPIDTRHLNTVLNKLVRDKHPAEVVEAARVNYENVGTKDDNISSRFFLETLVQNAYKSEEASDEYKLVVETVVKNLQDLDVAGLDTNKGLERYGGDIKAYFNILRTYTANVNSILDIIKVVNEDTLADYRIAVHGIKGSSLEIFAHNISESAEKLEDAALNRNIGYINMHNPTFIENTYNFIYDIKNMILAVDIITIKPKKDKPDNKVLKRLVTACETYNMTEINAAMEEIESYNYESDDGFIKWLRGKIDIMDYSQINDDLIDELNMF